MYRSKLKGYKKREIIINFNPKKENPKPKQEDEWYYSDKPDKKEEEEKEKNNNDENNKYRVSNGQIQSPKKMFIKNRLSSIKSERETETANKGKTAYDFIGLKPEVSKSKDDNDVKKNLNDKINQVNIKASLDKDKNDSKAFQLLERIKKISTSKNEPIAPILNPNLLPTSFGKTK